MKKLFSKTVITAILLMIVNLFITGTAAAQTLYDSYADGNFTANPVWGEIQEIGKLLQIVLRLQEQQDPILCI
jgi:hypothetical protein